MNRNRQSQARGRVRLVVKHVALGVIAAIIGAELVGPPIFYALTNHIPWAVPETIIPTAILVAIPVLYVFVRLEFKARAEAERAQKSRREVTLAHQNLSRITQFYRAISEINQLIARQVGAEPLLGAVCRTLTQRTATALAWVGSYNAGTGQVMPRVAAGAARAYVAKPLAINADPAHPRSGGGVGQAIQKETSVIINDLLADTGMSPWHDWAKQFGLMGLAAFPLKQNGKVTGVLAVYASRPGFFDTPLCELLGEVANDIGLALDSRERDLELELHARAVASSAEAIVVTDARLRVRSVNPTFTQVMGYTAAEARGATLRQLLGYDSAHPVIRSVVESVVREGRWYGEIDLRHKNGHFLPVRGSLAHVTDLDQKPSHYVVVFADQSQRLTLESRIEYMAYHDALTGLNNRHWLDLRVPTLLKQRSQVAFFLVDLDHFKQVNDALGHSGGDELLRVTGRRLSGLLRTRDAAVRLGGDEFIVVASVRSNNQARSIGERIVKQVSEPYRLKAATLTLTASVGVTVCPDDGRDWAELRKHLDLALRQAKTSGRNRCQVFESALRERAETALKLETALRSAVKDGYDLKLHYQRMLDVDGKTTLGAEALLRWRHPERGLISAGKFIPVAEATGLIQALDNWVLHAVVRQLRAWEIEGVCPPLVTVNLSATQCQTPNFPTRVRREISRAGLQNPQCLAFEIVETVLIDESVAISTVLNELRKQGHRLILDDWGKGYARLDYFTHAGIDGLKIDKSFIQGLPGDARKRELVQAIIRFGQTLGAQVVAEGVETNEQLLCLRELGCDAVQGYLFGRPIPAGKFADQILAPRI